MVHGSPFSLSKGARGSERWVERIIAFVRRASLLGEMECELVIARAHSATHALWRLCFTSRICSRCTAIRWDSSGGTSSTSYRKGITVSLTECPNDVSKEPGSLELPLVRGWSGQAR